ncbi:MAG TPA: VOC family protein [Acidimicrobiales bacterium]|nr:VOC family protein [Acidimicrobiales bacterium]
MADEAPEIGLVLDCGDPLALADFWAPALDYVSVGEVGSYVALFPNGRPGPKLLLQRVSEPRVAKNRMHLDIEVADIEAEATRLVALGATRVQDETLSEHGSTWILMADPEGNEFCICDAGQPAGGARG